MAHESLKLRPPNRISLYIAGRVFRGILLAFMIVVSIITLVDFVEGSRELESDVDISALQLLYLTLLKVPKLIEQTISFIILFGAMGALNSLNRRSELIVMRASGLSAWRFLSPALVVSATIGVLWAGLFNPIAVNLMAKYNAEMIRVGHEGYSLETSVWLREGAETSQRIIRAEQVYLSEKRIAQPTFYEMNILETGKAQFTRRYDAKSATLLAEGFWHLEDVIENAPNEDMRQTDTITLATTITLDDLHDQSSQTHEPAIWELGKEIAANEKAGFSARKLRLQLHKLLSLPFLLVAMTIIAAGVTMSLNRAGGTLRLIVTGAVLGFGVFFIGNVMNAFGEVSILPVILASWGVPVLTLLLGIAYLAKIEDG